MKKNFKRNGDKSYRKKFFKYQPSFIIININGFCRKEPTVAPRSSVVIHFCASFLISTHTLPSDC